MKVMHKYVQMKLLAVLLICALMSGILPHQDSSAQQNVSNQAGYGLSNPVVDSNGVTTWDCIYFGSYWQNDTTEKQKIKWRVLSVEGDDVFLLSDRNLSWQVYNNLSDKIGVTWETSTVRSWLNGYGAEDNICGQDYTDYNFFDDAFDAFEQAAIPDTLVVNTYDTSAYPSNNDTVDKVYLLSYPEIMKESYGFESTWNKSKKRVAKNTDHINSSESNGSWWLRTIGMTSSLGDRACYVDGEGRVWKVDEDASVSALSHVVRPALHLNLSARDGASNLIWSYAGKITSNGEEIEAELPTPAVPTESPVPEETAAPTPEETTQSPNPEVATQAPSPVETPQSPKPDVMTQAPTTPTPVVTPQSPTPELTTQAPTTQTPATQVPTPVVTPQSPTPETMTQAPTTQAPTPVVTPQSPTPEATATVSQQTPSASPSQSGVPSPGPVKVSSITVSGKITKLAKGKKAKLTPNVEPIDASNKNVVWSSSNPKVAVVDSNGTVTAKAAGKAVITATAVDGSGVSGSYKIEVVKHAIKKIIIKAKKSVAAGKKVKVKATIKTTGKNANKTLEWTTSNQKYATVTSRGVVTTKKAGKGKTVTITAMAMDGSGKKDTIKIKIK